RVAGLHWQQLVRVRSSRLRAKLRLLLGYLLHLAIVFRFNALTGFRGAEQRLMQSWALRSIAIKDGVPASRWFGWPFPRSRRIYGWLLRLYYSSWQRHASIERLFDEVKPVLVVLGHVQTHFCTPYALTASVRNIPILGVIGSWDQPTTKGPLTAGVTRFVVQSRAVADDLARYHAVPRQRIQVV